MGDDGWAIFRRWGGNDQFLGTLTRRGDFAVMRDDGLGDDDLCERVTYRLSTIFRPSVTEAFRLVRGAYEVRLDEWASERRAELAAENAWLIAAESDPESFDQMVREDMMGLS